MQVDQMNKRLAESARNAQYLFWLLGGFGALSADK